MLYVDCRHEEETPSSKFLCDAFCLHVATISTRNAMKLFTKFRFLKTITLKQRGEGRNGSTLSIRSGQTRGSFQKKHQSAHNISRRRVLFEKCFCQVLPHDFFGDEIGVVPFPTILEENNLEEMSERAWRTVCLGLFTSVTS